MVLLLILYIIIKYYKLEFSFQFCFSTVMFPMLSTRLLRGKLIISFFCTVVVYMLWLLYRGFFY